MTEKRFTPYKNNDRVVGFKDNITGKHHSSIIEARWILNDLWEKNQRIEKHYELLKKENKELKQENEYFKELLDKYEIETNDFDKFMNNREHTRLSINLETNELQRHIYATGNWFGDFDRVLVKQWLDEETYHRFIDRVIEVYNTEFKRSPKND